MILDAGLMFDEGRSISGGVSTNVLDLGAKGDTFGYRPVVVVKCDETAVGGTSLTVALQTCNEEGFGSNVVTLASSAAVARADLVKDSFALKLGVSTGLRRFVRLNYTASGTFTAGKVTAFMTVGEQHGIEEA